jgi:hypothetical protein
LVKFLKLFKRKVCYDHLLSKEEIKGFGVKALDNLNMKIGNYDSGIGNRRSRIYLKMTSKGI